jgi:hypothetical protein
VEGVQVARGEERQDLLDQGISAIEHREAREELEVLRALAQAVGSRHRQRVGMDRRGVARLLHAARGLDGQRRRGWRLAAFPQGILLRRIGRAEGQAGRRGRELVGRRVAARLGLRLGGRPLDAELRQVDVVDRSDAVLGAAERRLAGGATVDLASGGVGVAGPDELVDHDRPATGDAARGVQLLDVLAERDVDLLRAGQLRECRVEHAALRGGEKGDRRHLGERPRIGGDGAHPVSDGAPRRPAGAGPGVEDRVTGNREGGQLGVEQVVGRGREVSLEEREAGEASGKDDVVESGPRRLRHRCLWLVGKLLLVIGLG